MRFSPSLAALFALFFGNSLYAQFGVFTPGRIYIAHAATGQEPLSPESGLAPGSIAEINLQGIEENLGQARRVTIRIKTADTDDARDLAILNSQRSPGGIEIWFQVVIPADARPGPAELIATTDSSGTFTAPLIYFGDQFRCVPRGRSMDSRRPKRIELSPILRWGADT